MVVFEVFDVLGTLDACTLACKSLRYLTLAFRAELISLNSV